MSDAQTLRDYWSGHGHSGPSHGAERDAIGWGTPGDFARCVAMVTVHGKMTDEQAKGYCNLRHKDALGYYPGQHAAMERGKMTEIGLAAGAFERMLAVLNKSNVTDSGGGAGAASSAGGVAAEAQPQSDGGGEARVPAGSGLTSGQWTTGSDGPTKNPPKPNPYANGKKKPQSGKPPAKAPAKPMDAHDKHMQHLQNNPAARAQAVAGIKQQIKGLETKLSSLEAEKKKLSKTGVSNFGTGSTVKPASGSSSTSGSSSSSSSSSTSSTSSTSSSSSSAKKPSKTSSSSSASTQLQQINAQISQVHQQIAQARAQLKQINQMGKSVTPTKIVIQGEGDKDHDGDGLFDADGDGDGAVALRVKNVKNPRDRGSGRFRTFQGELAEAKTAISEGRHDDATQLLGSARVLAPTPGHRAVLDGLQAAIGRVQHTTQPDLVKSEEVTYYDPKVGLFSLRLPVTATT